MTFRNPIVAGLNLIRTAIRSPNYQAGTAGWSINRDGSADLADVTARGTLTVVGSNGSQVQADAGSAGAQLALTPAGTFTAATVQTNASGFGVVNVGPAIAVTSPVATGQTATTQLILAGRGGTVSQLPALIVYSGGLEALLIQDTAVSVPGTLQVSTGGDLTVAGASVPRGPLVHQCVYGSPVVSTPVNVETQVMNTPTFTPPAGRLYRITVQAQVSGASTSYIEWRVYADAVGGTLLLDQVRPITVNNDSQLLELWVYRSTAAASTALYLTAQSPVVCTIAGYTSNPVAIRLDDCGAYSAGNIKTW